MDKSTRCAFCHKTIGHQVWCRHHAQPSAPTSSEDSTTTNPVQEKLLHDYADSLLDYEKFLVQLQSLCGMPRSELWPIVMMVEQQRTLGLIQSGILQLTKNLYDSQA